MDSFRNGNVWYSKLESEVLLSQLYEKLCIFPDDEKMKVITSWLSNSFADFTNSGSLHTDSQNHFIVHVRLFNTLVSNSQEGVAHELSQTFLNDFLHSFVKPALLEATIGRSIDKATYYFQLVCENITQPLLIKKVIKFTITSLLPTLVARLRSKDSEILVATLGLFKALLEFYCEDLWHELILQYLLPMKHLMVSERQKAIPEINFQDSTNKFIDTIPSSIYNAISPETLSDHFTLYTQQELQRVRNINATISNAFLTLKSNVTGLPMTDAEFCRNKVYPKWTFKFDGSDIQHVTRRYKLSEPEEFYEDDLFQFWRQEDIQTPSTEECHSDEDNSRTGTSLNLPEGPESVRVYAEPVTFMHIRTPSASDPPGFIKPLEDQGYFGPFLESLFFILNNWTRLDPEVTIMISDVFSILASSRIPLITSILLDFSVVLQPCFPSFHSAIYTIRAKLDGSLKKYPESFVQQVWKQAASKLENNSMLENGDENLFQNSVDTFPENFRLRIAKSTPFSFVTQLYKEKTSQLPFAKLFGNTQTKTEAGGNTTEDFFVSKEDEIIAKRTVLRCIMFCHWCLELAAISQQMSWSQSRSTQRIEEGDDNQTD